MTTTQGGATAASTLELIERSRSSLLEASHSRGVAERYLQSRLAAMRAAAALVSARSATPSAAGPRSLWALLPSVAPELTEWADFFAVATLRDAEPLVSSTVGTPSTAGTPSTPGTPSTADAPSTAGAHSMAGAAFPVTAREADDLLRQTETFVDLVCRALGLPLAPPHGDVLVPTVWA
ncbi:MAG TPA: SAV_6107 family HEPN domain-containing protein [Pedococcus sp.]|nr:SAV_6107 family HEPN domain-containing protein [Pedococcus sp.]